jgi:hypothetical protein
MARTARGKKMGAPLSKFTPEIRKTIIEAIEAGNYVETSVQYAGITKSTFYSWLDKGTSERDRLIADPTATPDPDLVDFVDFADAVERAQASSEVRAVAIIQKAAFTTWQAAAWWLERTRPKRYARVDKAELTGAEGGSVRIEVSTEDLERKVGRILDKRAEA